MHASTYVPSFRSLVFLLPVLAGPRIFFSLNVCILFSICPTFRLRLVSSASLAYVSSGNLGKRLEYCKLLIRPFASLRSLLRCYRSTCCATFTFIVIVVLRRPVSEIQSMFLTLHVPTPDHKPIYQVFVCGSSSRPKLNIVSDLI